MTSASAAPRSATGTRSVCHGSTGSASPVSAAYAATSPSAKAAGVGPDRAAGPARRSRPACRRRRRARPAASRPARGPGRPRRRPARTSRPPCSPNVVGTACWVSVRATAGVSRCSAASRPSAAAVRSGRRRSPAAPAGTQHQPGVEDVLARRSLWTYPAAPGSTARTAAVSCRHQRDHRVAAAAGALGDRGQVDPVGPGRRGDRRGRRRRDQRPAGPGPGPAPPPRRAAPAGTARSVVSAGHLGAGGDRREQPASTSIRLRSARLHGGRIRRGRIRWGRIRWSRIRWRRAQYCQRDRHTSESARGTDPGGSVRFPGDSRDFPAPMCRSGGEAVRSRGERPARAAVR